MTTFYIDNTLTTGLNDGSSEANAFWGIAHGRGSLNSSTVRRVIFKEGSGPYREAFSSRGIGAFATDLSFASSDRSMNSVSTTLNTLSIAANDILEIFGSPLNSRQFTVATVAANKITFAATNTVTTEAAGAKVRFASLNTGSNTAALDLFGNGPAATDRRSWEFNGVDINCGRVISPSADYAWTQSANKREWYVKRTDGSNPSFVQPKCALINGVLVADTADMGLAMGTVNALTSQFPMGWGDGDSLGYSTVYVFSNTNPEDAGMEIEIGQVACGIRTNWQHHHFKDGMFTLGSTSANNGVAIYNSSSSGSWIVDRCIFRFQAAHAVETGAGSSTSVRFCVSFYAGHRGYYLSADATLDVLNCLDYGSHLFALIAAPVTAAGSLTIQNCVSVLNEAGVIDKKSAAAVLTEKNNIWYPRFGGSGSMLGYVSAANWTTTHASDFPPSAATTIATTLALEAAGGFDPSLVKARASWTSVHALKPTDPRVYIMGRSVQELTDILGVSIPSTETPIGPFSTLRTNTVRRDH